jgi:hypothetical protein
VYRAIKRLARIGAIEILKGTDRHPDFWSGDMNNYRVRFDRVPTDDGDWGTTSFYLDMLKPVEETDEAGNGGREMSPDVTPMSHQNPAQSGSNPGPVRVESGSSPDTGSTGTSGSSGSSGKVVRSTSYF